MKSVSVAFSDEMKEIVTGVEAVAGDGGALQPLGQLIREKDVAQFAVTVLLEQLIVTVALIQISVRLQVVEVNVSQLVAFGSHGHHAARPARLQPPQEQHGQQEVAQVVDSKDQAEPLLSSSTIY